MFCKHCGNPINDGAMFCHNCGASVNADHAAPQPQQQPQQYQQPPYQNAPQISGSNVLAIVGFILALVIPIAGLICSILGYVKAKNGAPYGGLALAGIIVSVALMVLYLILIITLYRYFYELFIYLFISGWKAG